MAELLRFLLPGTSSFVEKIPTWLISPADFFSPFPIFPHCRTRSWTVAADITWAMLMDKNKSISPNWELNNNFCAKRKIKIVMFCPQTWLPFHVSKTCT